jgi:hypothetical protein
MAIRLARTPAPTGGPADFGEINSIEIAFRDENSALT